ncbi:MAG: hypothetical protein COS99_01795 [Candidatus Omnitrophica bacterium CG07_land_8_20_14_0_80_42_15]|uniref:Uncharacterized protein n=1 Tax=Candidatus Aquitaenariimonas noxiae TaxID=1974741 RepID=A0A2J0L0C8_9BACT|nr:MAG: hypothetical protein COS99_01795 [Candidatus Omnitrophica bacterium CG07_land_8_20_14_0_80_42_15]
MLCIKKRGGAEMKGKRILIIGAMIIFAGIVALASIHFMSRQKPELLKKEKAEEILIKEEEPVKGPKVDKPKEAKPALQETPEAEAPAEQEAVLSARLRTEPSEVEIEVEEGGRKSSEFTLINDGPGKVLFNIYKVDKADTPAEIDQAVEQLIAYKKDKLPEKPAEEDLEKTGLFRGAPWLIQFPYYGILGPGETLDVKLAAVASNLEIGSNSTNLIILGLNKEEIAVVPVHVEVKAAPRIRFADIKVDDGVTPGTKGNLDNVAGPGEKVAFTVYLDNQGNGKAKGLTVTATADNASVTVLEGEAKLDFVEAKGRFNARFLIDVSDDAITTSPPSVTLTIKDSEGREWTENFYVGEPGKFDYPTGLISDEKKPEKVEEGL